MGKKRNRGLINDSIGVASPSLYQGIKMHMYALSLTYEVVDPIVLAIKDQSRNNHCMIGRPSQPSGPPFGSLYGGCVDIKLIRFRDIGCSCLKGTDVGTMTELSLRIASQDLMIWRKSDNNMF